MMDRDLRDRWCAALRSGNYKQGMTYLCQHDGDHKLYCCLGVLCDIQGVEFTDVVEYDDYDDTEYLEDYLTCRLGEETLSDEGEEFGLTKRQHETCYRMNDGGNDTLTCLNLGIENKPYTFAEIADWIEKNL